jgi:hypothetical protein
MALALAKHPFLVSNPITIFINVLKVPKYFPAKFNDVIAFFVSYVDIHAIPNFFINSCVAACLLAYVNL